MKALFLAMVAVAALEMAAFSQGSVWFSNRDPNRITDAPVYMSDGVTRLSGPQFQAELLAGPSAGDLSSIATTGFAQGSLAGYFFGQVQYITSVVPGQLTWVEVHVWNTASGPTFLQAQASGLPDSWWASTTFTIVPGGGPVNPFPPAALAGLGTSPVFLNSVPEPSAAALGSLVALVVSGYSRRRSKTG